LKKSLHDINDDLLVKYLVGEASHEEVNLINDWLQNSAENQKKYEDFIFIWEKSLQLATVNAVDTDGAWIRMQERLKKEEAKSSSVKIFSLQNTLWLRVAAVFLVVAFGLVTYFVINKNTAQQFAVINIESAEKILTETLPDGSVITVNKNSKLSYPSKFNGNAREITMEGEAFFTITPDKTKPFIIHVNDITVKVVGTSFNIKSVNGKTEVIVETGIVQVIKQNSTVELTPGQKVVTEINDASIVKDSATDKLYNYYRSKEFICDNTPLKRLVDILNEAYSAHIIIENKSLENLPITTVFKDETLENILNVISETLGITIEKNREQVILK